MTLTLEQIVQTSRQAPFVWERQDDGRYTIFDRPLSEPHNYDGDVFTKARQDAILETTRREEPDGGMWVGHPGFGDNEAPVTGRMVNYRETKLGMGRHLADWVDIEPTAFLDIILKRWRSYSIEYRLPNLDAYKGVALLGRSQAFFDFARLNPPKLSDAEMKQLRQDAEAWPKTMAARSVTTRNHDPKGTRDMKKKYRQIAGKDGSLRWQVAEVDEDGNVGEYRNLREGDTVEKDDEEMGRVRAAVEEIGNRMANLEKRMDRMEDQVGGGNDDGGEDDDEGRAKDEGDEDDDEKNRAKKTGKSTRATVRRVEDKAIRALNERLDKADRKATRNRYDGKIDSLVAGGAVIDKTTRATILDAVLKADEAKRGETFEALTKSIRKAPTTDQDDGGQIDSDDPLFADYDEDDQKALRGYFGRLGPNARKVARKELKAFNELRAKDPNTWGVAAGPLNWLEANITPGVHDEDAA